MKKYLKRLIFIISSNCEILIGSIVSDIFLGYSYKIKNLMENRGNRNRDLDKMINKLDFLIPIKEKRKNMRKEVQKNIIRYLRDKIMLQCKNLSEELVSNKEN